ncbi:MULTISPECIES: HU family DNA-binding protein [Neobacillus]|uniref:HU family DNA-binding protein n=1 Tax=Neobacillus rhizophilus TaxID=2833579 RepID=A0A942U9T4_9BACI|nr:MULTISPECIES: HU family DNA-binding protein [Neobacillus]MBS4214848.1 HU family DNA-binding protein [Neobacillus rhizophilus]MBU8918918.1 HU family DNA-binding protein [Bacillus sp. FJAT-29953]
MNKTQLINAVSAKSELSRKDAESAVEAVFDIITQSLVCGDSLALLGFGKFEVCQREARTRIDPKTGEESIIQAGKVPVFRASKSLIQKI